VEIFLNGQRLDFTLEAERTVSDVAAALDAWLATGALCVTSVDVDGGRTASSEWDRIAVAGAARLDVSVSRVTEARVDALRTAAEFLRLLRAAVSGRDESLLRDLAVGYPAMVEGVRSILCPQPGDELWSHLVSLDQLLAGNTPERIARWPPETADAAALALDGLATSVARSLQETDDPRQALPRVRAELMGALAELEQVSVLLQTGRDREAMGKVIVFSELTQGLLRLIARLGATAPAGPPLLVAGRPLDEFQAALNGVLRQLLEAFDARDTVLIGDLLEYEAAPLLRQLAAAAGALESPPGSAG
jgi:hypothetical protein